MDNIEHEKSAKGNNEKKMQLALQITCCKSYNFLLAFDIISSYGCLTESRYTMQTLSIKKIKGNFLKYIVLRNGVENL